MEGRRGRKRERLGKEDRERVEGRRGEEGKEERERGEGERRGKEHGELTNWHQL